MMMFGHAPITCTVVGVTFVVVLWGFVWRMMVGHAYIKWASIKGSIARRDIR